MSKQNIKLLISILAGLFLGLIYVAVNVLTSIFLPAYHEAIKHVIYIVLISIISIIILIIFVYLVINVSREMKFQMLVKEELRNNGYSKDLHNAVEKRLNKNKNKTDLPTYYDSLNYVALEAQYNNNYEEVFKVYEGINLNELAEKLKVYTGKGNPNNYIAIINMLDIQMSTATYLKDDAKVDEIYPVFEKIYNCYYLKNPALDMTLMECKILYEIYKGKYEKAESSLDSIKEKDNLYNLIKIIADVLTELGKKTLTVEKLDEYNQKGKEISEASFLKKYQLHLWENFYNNTYKELTGNSKEKTDEI